MQYITDNNEDNPTSSGNRNDQQEAHEQDYVDTTRKVINTTDDTGEQAYVDTDQGGINTTNDDEYNTFNTHPVPLHLDPNYDHMPKSSHTNVDET